MTSAQDAETSVTKNSAPQNSFLMDDQFPLRYVILGWIKPFPIWSKLMLLFYTGPCFVAFQVETLVRDMDNIYIKSIQAVQKVMINDKHCFELYPFT